MLFVRYGWKIKKTYAKIKQYQYLIMAKRRIAMLIPAHAWLDIIKNSWNYVFPEHHCRGRVKIVRLRSININVIPSFGHIVNINEVDKQRQVWISRYSSKKLRPGDRKRVLFTSPPRISIPPDMLPSASGRSSRNLSMPSRSMSMLRGPDSAEDSDSDHQHLIIHNNLSLSAFPHLFFPARLFKS